MDFCTTGENIAIRELIFSESVEQAVDCEFSLPDYCPDIERIIKCIVTPKIMSTVISGSSVAIEGITFVNTLYVESENGQLRSHEVQVSFTRTVDLKHDCDGAVVITACKVDYMNCRAVSERKLEIHGAFSVNFKGNMKKSVEVVSEAQGAGIQLQKCLMDITEMTGYSKKQIMMSEELELSQSNGAIKYILRHKAVATYSDCKIISNKVIIKGELMISMLYVSNELLYEKFDYAMPISQIIDVDGIDDGCYCKINMNVLSCELKPRTNISGESRTVSAIIKLEIEAFGSKQKNVSIVTDAYSTKYELVHEMDEICFERKLVSFNEQHLAKSSIEVMNSDIVNVIDLWCEVCSKEVCLNENGLTVSGDILVVFIAKNSENMIYCHEKTISYEHHIKGAFGSHSAKCDVSVKIIGCNFSISQENMVDVRCEIQIVGEVTEKFKLDVMTQLNMDETKCRMNENDAALIIYYAETGESIWNIARRYNTSVDEMIALNNLAGDKLLAKTMLLIPSV